MSYFIDPRQTSASAAIIIIHAGFQCHIFNKDRYSLSSPADDFKISCSKFHAEFTWGLLDEPLHPSLVASHAEPSFLISHTILRMNCRPSTGIIMAGRNIRPPAHPFFMHVLPHKLNKFSTKPTY